MTRHRLVRCQAATLLSQVSRRHTGGHVESVLLGTVQPGSELDPSPVKVTPWLGGSRLPRTVTRWRQRLPGNRWLDCWLEIEQGANGVLAHLTVAPTSDTTWPLSSRLSRIAVEAWTAHELTALARGAESAA
jgi:hypothetical protein